MSPPPRSVVILGGGTAGWMTANLLHKGWAESGTHISLIESSAIGIIGVGEGSTPQLKAFFDALGIAEEEWMPRCNATYKAGIEFTGWSMKSSGRGNQMSGLSGVLLTFGSLQAAPNLLYQKPIVGPTPAIGDHFDPGTGMYYGGVAPRNALELAGRGSPLG